MPYNTTAIPLERRLLGRRSYHKIIAQDQDINICSNNAAFVICLAAEMFVQHIAEEALKQAKTERKPRRNIQYKDIANAAAHQDNLEFLEDVVPKTVKFRDIKATAEAKRASLRGERAKNDANGSVLQEALPVANGSSAKKHKSNGSRSSLNGSANIAGMLGGGAAGSARQSHDDEAADPNDQLEMESRQARGEAADEDVAMTG
ncbi:Histone-fold protein [Apiospora rasikravindrae]|uniref:Histone-fold protein n=1 Tax=Apiospora rasikravindrae TaxID=990691 RepID=A0ABR1TY38_9PEZI